MEISVIASYTPDGASSSSHVYTRTRFQDFGQRTVLLVMVVAYASGYYLSCLVIKSASRTGLRFHYMQVSSLCFALCWAMPLLVGCCSTIRVSSFCPSFS